MRELGNYLYQNGISVYCPRFARVDTREKMVTWESWVTQADTALDTVMAYSSNVFVVGLSLGATISLVLARERTLKGLVLLAPALFPRMTLKGRFYQIVRLLVPPLFYRFAGWNGEVLKAMDFARKSAKRVRLPVLVMQASDDTHLSSRGVRFIRRHARLKRNEFHTLATGGHVLTSGPSKDEVFQRVRDFVHRNASDVELPEKTDTPAPMPAAEVPDSLDQPESRQRRGRRGGSRERGRQRRDSGDRRGGGDRRRGDSEGGGEQREGGERRASGERRGQGEGRSRRGRRGGRRGGRNRSEARGSGRSSG
jgi:esterase/lipase